MQDFRKIDARFGLTPWTLKEHAQYIAGVYGSLLSDPAVAERYLENYERAEKAFDEAYEKQGELLAASSRDQGIDPQELPKIEKLDWDPRKLFTKAKTEKPVKIEVSEEKPVKIDGRTKKAKEAKIA